MPTNKNEDKSAVIVIWMGIFLGAAMPFCALAAGEINDSPDSAKYETIIESTYRTTFPEAPNMVFDVPPDTRIVKVGAGIQVESQYHYLSRKLIAQERRMDTFGQQLEKMKEQLGALDERVKKIEGMPGKKAVSSSSISVEQ